MGEQSQTADVVDPHTISVESIPACDDRTLMERAQAGDEEAFGGFVRRYERTVHAYLRARLLRASDADDLAQEVFLRCYQARARIDTESLVRSFLMGIARNVLREHARTLRRRKEVIWIDMCLELDQTETEEEGTYDDLVGLLPECLEELGDNARAAVEMYYRRRLRHAEIGEHLNRSAGAVKLLLFRARRALRLCLDRKLKKPRMNDSD